MVGLSIFLLPSQAGFTKTETSLLAAAPKDSHFFCNPRGSLQMMGGGDDESRFRLDFSSRACIVREG